MITPRHFNVAEGHHKNSILQRFSLGFRFSQPFIRRGLPNAVMRSRQKYHYYFPGSSHDMQLVANAPVSASRFLVFRPRKKTSLQFPSVVTAN